MSHDEWRAFVLHVPALQNSSWCSAPPTEIGGRYMGADQVAPFARRNGVPIELLVRVTPANVLAKTGISD